MSGYPCYEILCNQGEHIAIPSSCGEDKVVQYQIVTKQALPVPPLISNILDRMYCWGRVQDQLWYYRVVDWIHFLLPSNVHISDRRIILRDCAKDRIRNMVHQTYPNMVLVSPSEFTLFLVQNASIYPYSEILNTRCHFYVKVAGYQQGNVRIPLL